MTTMSHEAYINCNANKSAAELIAQSERNDEIVHAPYDAAIAADLLADSDDCAENGDVTEYWGESWRVHLHT